jgi:ankyrin repeat protein
MVPVSTDVAADELVPLASFLLLKSDIPNWTANFSFLRKFNPSHVMDEKHRYCLTTYEVALEYLRTGELTASERVESGQAAQNMSRLERSESHMEDQSLDGFFKAVIGNDIDHVLAILDAKRGTSALCHPLCVCDKCEEIIKKLDYVPTARSRDKRGRTALHYAAKSDFIDMVNLLMKHGALVDAPDHNGTTPLHLACQQGKQAAVLLLIHNGADINAMDSDCNTPLHIACSHGHDVVVKSLLFSTVKCKINAVNHEENTPLHNAAKWGFASVVRMLLLHGARLDVTNSNMQTPVDVAHSRVKDVIENRRASVRAKSFSVMEGSLPPPRDQQMKRPHRSGRRGHDREVNKLLAAAESGDVNLVGFLLDWGNPLKSQGPPPELCHPFCQCKKCLPFTQASLNVNSHDSDGLTALHKAAMHGRVRMCEELVRHGANINVKSTAKKLTPLHYACIYGRDKVVVTLLQAGVDVSCQDFHGNTALHSCAISGNFSSAKNLLDNQADINALDLKGNTPLHHAARWSHTELVTMLLERGADFSIVNEDGQLPYSLCKDEQVKEVFASFMSERLVPVNSEESLA